MIIEKAMESDAQEILALQKLAYISEAEIYNDFNIPPLIQTLEQITKDFDNHTFLKFLDDGKITGSVRACVIDAVCTICRLIVHPGCQNRGIGTSLIKKVEEMFCECNRFEIFTGHKSERNIYLYQKLGYILYKKEKVTDDLSIVYLAK